MLFADAEFHFPQLAHTLALLANKASDHLLLSRASLPVHARPFPDLVQLEVLKAHL